VCGIFRRARRRCPQTLRPRRSRRPRGLASVRGLDWLGHNRRRDGASMSIKLTDTQLVSAGRRSPAQGPVSRRPANAQGATAQKVASKLISAGFVKEVKAKASDPIWRRDEESGASYCSRAPPPRAPKRSWSMTPPKSDGCMARKAPRPRTVIRQLSCQSWTPRTLHPQEAMEPGPIRPICSTAADFEAGSCLLCAA